MGAKLIKTDVNYILEDDKGVVIASTSLKKEGLSLSIKNCQAIERGYDLDELISETDTSHLALFTSDSHELMYDEGFKAGFQKALELMGDKKFSEDDVLKVVTHILNELVFVDGFDKQYLFPETVYQETTAKCKSLQQTEWDVFVEMEKVYDGLDEMAQPQYSKQPKLDADGCLILKRI